MMFLQKAPDGTWRHVESGAVIELDALPTGTVLRIVGESLDDMSFDDYYDLIDMGD